MLIQILGSGCAKCNMLAENAALAANEMKLEFTLEKVTGLQQIMAFGVMVTPALVVDGVVKSAGKVLTVADIKKVL